MISLDTNTTTTTTKTSTNTTPTTTILTMTETFQALPVTSQNSSDEQENMVEMSIDMSASASSTISPPQSINLTTYADFQNQRQIFDTPLSNQRYSWCQDYIANNVNIKCVTDLGCGSGRQMLWYKKVPHLEILNFVDIDDVMLEDNLHNHFRPGLWEMLFGRQNTRLPLNIKVYHGDMTVPDDRLNADCFMLIEVIEHLKPEDVDRAVRTIFGFYKPKSIVISTPNSEFNHLLRQPGESPTKFRHYDHKFEWTRQEFVFWCAEICKQFPNYGFYLDGVGHLPGSEPFGPCTQIAVFHQVANQAALETKDLDNAVCLDLLLDKLNVKETIPERRIDRERKKVSLITEFNIPGCVGEPINDDDRPVYYWN